MGKLICLLGKKRTGKDSCGDYLISKYNFTRYAFADPIKEILKILFDFSNEQLNDDKEKIDERWNVSPREVLQKFGTEMCRNNLDKYLPKIKETMNNETIWIKLFRFFYMTIYFI